MTYTPKYTITDATAVALTAIERARGFLEAAKLSEDWVAGMQRRALVLEAHHTTHIEGTHLTLEQSERILAGKSVPEANPDDARELLNYRDAFELVAEYLGSGEPVTEALIRQVHKRLVIGVRGDSGAPGEYRRVQNYVVNSRTKEVVYTPPPPQDVPPMMKELIAWLGEAKQMNPVLEAGAAQFQLVHIHPFVDGNGRSARLLSTLCLYRKGYDFKRLFTISEYYDRDRAAYYRAIQSVRASGMDLTKWLEYFAEGLAVQMREVQEKGERVIRADVLARKHRLSDRQRAALGHALEHGLLALQDYAALCPKANRRTLQRDLKAMVDKGLLIQEGSGPAAHYRMGKVKK
ncbi:MAG: Fic family protein [Candidatus Aureabacteria bacterium]|nr:Fic family protein [Candidatus Auribacterota bacterium]